MPLKIAQQFIDLLLINSTNIQPYLDTQKSTAVILDFIGGEPFLEVELIDDILEYFQKRTIELNHPWQYHWRINISSNGTLYFQPNVQKFLQKWKNRLSFSISIDGNKKLHDSCRVFPDGKGSYDIAIAAVKHYTTVFQGEMGSKMTLAPNNIKYIYEAVINLIQLGYKEINLNCIFEKGWTKKHAKILYKQLKKIGNYILNNNLEDKIIISIFNFRFFRPMDKQEIGNWCGGNGQMLAVDWKGDIYPCIRYMESSLGKELQPIIIGNVSHGLMQTEEEKQWVKKLRSLNRISQSTQECIDCKIAEGCAWCQAYNYQDSHGNLNKRATHICIMHQATALANYYYWNKYFQKHNLPYKMKIWLENERALQIINFIELYKLKKLQFYGLNQKG